MRMMEAQNGSAGSNAGTFPKPNVRLLVPHLIAKHDLIPLHKPTEMRDSRSIGKAPLDNNWPKRSYDGQDPKAWMAQGRNVGVRLHDDQLVIDVDPRNFDGGDRLADLCAKFSISLDDYPYVRTGGGGLHIYMRKPPALSICGKLDGMPGIEFQTKGKQLVAAGSVHPETGRHYVADDPFEMLCNPPMAPEALLRAIERKAAQTGDCETQITNEQLAQLLAVLDPVEYSPYDKWIRMMMACHQGTGGEGVEEFVSWAAGDPQYADHKQRNRDAWDSLDADRGNGITVRTLFKAVSEAGHPELVAAIGRAPAAEDFAAVPMTLGDLNKGRGGAPAPSFSNCLKVLEMTELGFAYDELARRALLRGERVPWSIDIGRELNDDVLRILRHFLVVQTRIEFSKENVVEAALTLARQSPFNPVVEYLDRLKWDGTKRIDDWLVKYLGAEDTEYVRAVGRLVLLGAVRRAKSPGCKFDYVAILEGKQGTGKSSALSILGGTWYSDAELGHLDSKEAPQVLQGVWIYELGELTALRQAETEDLKAFVSRCEDRYRAPYERTARGEARRCIFIGTTNAESYLTDTTGNRRFWPVKTGAIDLDALKRDRDQLWAEAAQQEVTCKVLELPRHLWALAAEVQAERMAEDPWKDRIRMWLDGELVTDTLDGPKVSERRNRVHTRELLELVLCMAPGRQNQQMGKRLRDVMRQIGGWTYKQALRIEGQSTAAGYQRDDAS